MKEAILYSMEDNYSNRKIKKEDLSVLIKNRFALDNKSLSFDMDGLTKINKSLFKTLYSKDAGKLRTWDDKSIKDSNFIEGKLRGLFDSFKDAKNDYFEISKNTLCNKIARFISKATKVVPFELGNLDTINTMADYYARINGFYLNFKGVDEKKFDSAIEKSHKLYGGDSQDLVNIIDRSLAALSLEDTNHTRQMFGLDKLKGFTNYKYLQFIDENTGKNILEPVEKYERRYDKTTSLLSSTYYDGESNSLVHQYIKIIDSKQGFIQDVYTGTDPNKLERYSLLEIDKNGVAIERIKRSENSHYTIYEDDFRQSKDIVIEKQKASSVGKPSSIAIRTEGVTNFKEEMANYSVNYKYTSSGTKELVSASSLIFDERYGDSLNEVLDLLTHINYAEADKKDLIGMAFFNHTEFGTDLDTLCVIQDYSVIKGTPTALISKHGNMYKVENFLKNKQFPTLTDELKTTKKQLPKFIPAERVLEE